MWAGFPRTNSSVCNDSKDHYASHLTVKPGLNNKHFLEEPLNFANLSQSKNIIASEMEVVRVAYAALSHMFPQGNCHKAGSLTKVLLGIVD